MFRSREEEGEFQTPFGLLKEERQHFWNILIFRNLKTFHSLCPQTIKRRINSEDVSIKTEERLALTLRISPHSVKSAVSILIGTILYKFHTGVALCLQHDMCELALTMLCSDIHAGFCSQHIISGRFRCSNKKCSLSSHTFPQRPRTQISVP